MDVRTDLPVKVHYRIEGSRQALASGHTLDKIKRAAAGGSGSHCIRGDEADLEKMIRLLGRDDLNRPTQRSYVVTFLNCLGVQALSVASIARELIQSGQLPADEQKGLQGFLNKVVGDVGPTQYYSGR